MSKRHFMWCFKLMMAISLLLIQGHAFGYDITDKFYVGGVIAGAYQHQWADGDDNLGRGALPFQPEFSFRPTKHDEIFANFGFAAGNGLNGVTDFNLAPWAADLEDDVKDINGRSRDYLLTVWYKHTFELGESKALTLTGGIIDATAYIDENAYANDEYTQFMNEALVNAPNAFAPSYGIGYGYLNGKNDFDYTQVAEGYWRFVLNDYFAVTVDLQCMQDKFDTDEDDIEGIIGGIRMTTEF